MAAPLEVGHIHLNGCIVCHGCGALVYVASDALAAHLAACPPLQAYNRKRLAGEPLS